jgi:hypothetical protein
MGSQVGAMDSFSFFGKGAGDFPWNKGSFSFGTRFDSEDSSASGGVSHFPLQFDACDSKVCNGNEDAHNGQVPKLLPSGARPFEDVLILRDRFADDLECSPKKDVKRFCFPNETTIDVLKKCCYGNKQIEER